jgi:osmotically-inducible protein OsmY
MTRAIERHFQDEALLRSEHLQAKVTLGIATLSGSVGSLMAKERALAVTETIRGVRAVVDEVTVVPVARTDAELERDVNSALRDDPSTRSLSIGVAAKDGVVTLSGTADSWQQRKMVADIAAEVPGVKGVDNAVVAHYGAARPPEEIAADVRHRLANDVWLDGDALTVTVTGRKVQVSGFVGSVAQKRRANYDEWVAGVDDVDDDGIVVDWAAERDQRRVDDAPMRSDSDIARAVRDAFFLDPRLKAFAPQVAVNHGQVVLSGTLDSAKARRAAEADARDTVGVWSVRDDALVTPGAKPTDADIDRNATRLLAADGTLPDGKQIQVTTAGGIVALHGVVAAAFERAEAVDDVADVAGVAEIDDELTVGRTVPEIKADIEDRLFWDPRVERNAVAVTVSPDRTATLTGTLTAWSEIKAAAEDATVGGASRVVDNLALNRHPDFVAR